MSGDKRAEIEKVLRDFGVPLVQCSDCIVEGDLPAHGPYTAPPPAPPSDDKSSVTLDQLKSWLAAGADVNEELDNAVLASDLQRVAFLVDKGADVVAVAALLTVALTCSLLSAVTERLPPSAVMLTLLR